LIGADRAFDAAGFGDDQRAGLARRGGDVTQYRAVDLQAIATRKLWRGGKLSRRSERGLFLQSTQHRAETCQIYSEQQCIVSYMEMRL